MPKASHLEKENSSKLSAMVIAGPMLREVLAVQDIEFRCTEYPRVEAYAERLVALARELGHPVIWPVGRAAERLVGSAIVVGKGQLRARDWNSRLSGESALLVCIAAATPLPLYVAAAEAMAFGAGRVMACGVSIRGLECSGNLDAYYWLGGAPQLVSAENSLAV